MVGNDKAHPYLRKKKQNPARDTAKNYKILKKLELYFLAFLLNFDMLVASRVQAITLTSISDVR